MLFSFIIPCYCSEKNIDAVIYEIETAMNTHNCTDYEIILVNDCSPDNTWQALKNIREHHDHTVLINFSKNFGQPAALLAGFHYASGEYIMTSDDDGQTPVGKVWEFYEKLQEGYDVVCAKYPFRKQPSLIRRLGTCINEKMARLLLHKPENIMLSSFFIAKRFVIKELIRYDNAYPYIAGLLLRTTHNIGNLLVEPRNRASGTSGYSIKKLLKLWLNGFTSFSVIPLRIAVLFGVLFSGGGLITVLIVIIRKLQNPEIFTGWSSLIASVFLVGGVILMVLGMAGEYIGRIYICLNKSPQYVIKETISERPSLHDKHDSGI